MSSQQNNLWRASLQKVAMTARLDRDWTSRPKLLTGAQRLHTSVRRSCMQVSNIPQRCDEQMHAYFCGCLGCRAP